MFEGNKANTNYSVPIDKKTEINNQVASTQKKTEEKLPVMSSGDIQLQPLEQQANPLIINVAQNDIEANLTKEQKEKVKTTVDATKKVLSNLQWKVVETAIADVLTDQEKQVARQQYVKELNKAAYWKNVEQNMKAQYQNINWQAIDNKMDNALAAIKLDSLEKTYTIILDQLNKVTANNKAEVKVCPLPDQSIEQIQETKEELSNRVNTIKAIKSGQQVVRL